MSSLGSQRSTTCSPRSAKFGNEVGAEMSDSRKHCIEPLGKNRGGPYLGGGEGGLGVPVVSYAPRPMLVDSFSLAIIVVLVDV